MSEEKKTVPVEMVMAGEIRRNYIRAKLDRRTLLEQAAEEASELTQALLKLVRAEKLNNNPTPVSREEALNNVDEELDDLLFVLELAGLKRDRKTNEGKSARWCYRLMAEEANYEFFKEAEKKE